MATNKHINKIPTSGITEQSKSCIRNISVVGMQSIDNKRVEIYMSTWCSHCVTSLPEINVYYEHS